MHWVFLTLAIVAEVLGSLLMKSFVDQGNPLLGTAVVVSSIALSYVFLSQATERIPVALANAFWEGAGMVLIALLSYFFLGEYISNIQMAALLLAVVGITLTHLGHALQCKNEES